MEKIKENLIKDWKFFLVLSIAIIAFLMLSFYSLKISDKLYKTSNKIEAENYIENIKTGDIIEQKINCEENNFKRVDIEFEPFKEKANISGKVKIGIKDSNGKIIKEEIITRNYIREKPIYEFEFETQRNSKDKDYILSLEFEDKKENDEYFSVKSSNQVTENELQINGQKIEGNLAIQKYYESSTKSLFFIAIAFLFSIYAFGICTYIYYNKEIKIEKIFLLTVPVICLFYIITMPTFKNHDELYHWYRCYEVSIGQLATGIDGDKLGTEMPASIAKPVTQDWTKITYHDVQENLEVGLEEENKALLYSETSALYSFIQYLPQGIGIFIARIFTDKVLLLAYAGRLANMIFALTCIYLAIKKIPFGKKILLLISYIPISIEGFSSLSPDAMTTSVAMLYIAYILNLAFSKDKVKVNKKQKIVLTILSIVMALCKIVYIPLVLLMFIIPKEKFENGNKSKIKSIILIAGIACIANLIWLGISSVYLAHFREGDSAVQVKTLLLNPIKYIQNCLYTANLNGKNYIYTMFGGELGWGELIKINSIVPYTLFILAIWTTIIDKSIKDKFKLYQKNIIFLTTIIIIGLIFTSLYVQWTPCESDSIAGIQGRYFIPILPLIIMIIGSQIKVNTKYEQKNIAKSIGIIGTLLQIIVILPIVICHL